MQASVGVSVVELERTDGWRLRHDSRFNRRITAHYANAARGSGARSCAARRRRRGTGHVPWHARQLRCGGDAVGNLPHGRGEHRRLFREPRASGARAGAHACLSALQRAPPPERLSLGGRRCALRCRAQRWRAAQVRLDCRDRSAQPRRADQEADGAWSIQARRRDDRAHERRPRRRLHGRRRGIRVLLQIRVRRQARPVASRSESRPARFGNALRGQAFR